MVFGVIRLYRGRHLAKRTDAVEVPDQNQHLINGGPPAINPQPASNFFLVGELSCWRTIVHLITSLDMSTAIGTTPGGPQATLNYTTSEAGNPFVGSWYADPGSAIYDGLFWVYPTTSCAYNEQTHIDAFSSPDLINWTKHPKVLTVGNVAWATKALWAPTPISRNGKYYLYFSANDIQEDEVGAFGGIGVAVADKPEGPFVDAIGKPLIGSYHNGAQPIDQDVFVDDVSQNAYIYYGGHSHANVAMLNKDMISIGAFNDGTVFKEITPITTLTVQRWLNATAYTTLCGQRAVGPGPTTVSRTRWRITLWVLSTGWPQFCSRIVPSRREPAITALFTSQTRISGTSCIIVDR